MDMNSDDSFEFAGYSRYITMTGATDRRGYLHRSTSSGGTNFSETIVEISQSIDEYIFGMGRDSNGNLIIGGAINDNAVNPSFEFFVAKLDNTGDVFDSNFGNNGLIRTSFSDNAVARDLQIQSDDKILLIGYVGDDIAITRYTPQTLSIENVKPLNNIKIYPNPTSDFLNISMIAPIEVNEQFKIYDLTGRLVLTSQIDGADTTIDVSSLNAGVYIVGVKNQSYKFEKI
jgi:hypothetical protein